MDSDSRSQPSSCCTRTNGAGSQCRQTHGAWFSLRMRSKPSRPKIPARQPGKEVHNDPHQERRHALQTASGVLGQNFRGHPGSSQAISSRDVVRSKSERRKSSRKSRLLSPQIVQWLCLPSFSGHFPVIILLQAKQTGTGSRGCLNSSFCFSVDGLRPMQATQETVCARLLFSPNPRRPVTGSIPTDHRRLP